MLTRGAPALGLLHDLQRALVIGGNHLDEAPRRRGELVEQLDAARARRIADVLLDEGANLLELGLRWRAEPHHLGIAAGCERATLVIHIGDAARHARSEILPDLA